MEREVESPQDPGAHTLIETFLWVCLLSAKSSHPTAAFSVAAGLLSEEEGVALREEEDDPSGVAEMAMFPGLSESDSISRSFREEEEEEESAGENRLEDEELKQKIYDSLP